MLIGSMMGTFSTIFLRSALLFGIVKSNIRTIQVVGELVGVTMKKLMIIIFGFALAFFAVHNFFLYGNSIEYWASYLMYPILVVQSTVVDPCVGYINRCRVIEVLQKENDALRERNTQLHAQLIETVCTLEYAQDIHDLVVFKKRYGISDALIVPILMRHFSEKEHYFFVEGGLDRGIKQGMVVIADAAMVGKVIHVYPWYSKIMLISDAHCRIAAVCTKTRTRGIYEGMNNREQARLTYVNHCDPLVPGELVVSSGKGLVYPQGFGLGSIGKIDQGHLYYSVTLNLLPDFESITHCLILTSTAHIFDEPDATS
jgi:rod shape-determining protein MreC